MNTKDMLMMMNYGDPVIVDDSIVGHLSNSYATSGSAEILLNGAAVAIEFERIHVPASIASAFLKEDAERRERQEKTDAQRAATAERIKAFNEAVKRNEAARVALLGKTSFANVSINQTNKLTGRKNDTNHRKNYCPFYYRRRQRNHHVGT